ncbi:MAG: hypothetical protein AAFX01_04075 [Cyanobacteria bacterium J06638_28]
MAVFLAKALTFANYEGFPIHQRQPIPPAMMKTLLCWVKSQPPFEVYKLINGTYRLQLGEPYWMLGRVIN